MLEFFKRGKPDPEVARTYFLFPGHTASLYVPSAEGETTYPGFGDDPESDRARAWVARRLLGIKATALYKEHRRLSSPLADTRDYRENLMAASEHWQALPETYFDVARMDMEATKPYEEKNPFIPLDQR
jgi:hypothetical protein